MSKFMRQFSQSIRKPARSSGLPQGVLVVFGVAALGSLLLIFTHAATNTVSYSGHLNNKSPSASYSITPSAAGSLSLQASFNSKLSSVTLIIKDSSGNTLGSQTSGTSPVSLNVSVGANATYTTTISGAGNGNYTLNVTYPALDLADTSPPSAPTSLTSSSQTVGSIALSWVASTDNVGVTGYDIYRAGTKVGSSTTTAYTDSGLTAGTSYSYYVKARDGAGNTSQASNTLSVSTAQAGDTQAPTAPSNLTSPSQTTTNISLGWVASTDNVGVTGYDIYRAGTKVGSSTTTAYTDSGLTAGTSYSYYVKARDGAGNVSGQSNTLTISSAAADTTRPTVSFSSPASGTTVTGSISVSGSVGDNSALPANPVTLQIDNGVSITPTYTTSSSTSGSFSYGWDTTLLGNGSHTITARAVDTSGNTATATTTVTVSNQPNTGDTTRPTVQSTSFLPQPAAHGTSSSLSFLAYDYDYSGITRAEYTIGNYPSVPISITAGTQIQPTVTFDSTKYADGTYYLTVYAYDAAGNVGQQSVQMVISNAAHYEDKTYPDGTHIVINSIGINPYTNTPWTADWTHDMVMACAQGANDYNVIAPHYTIQVQDIYASQTVTSFSNTNNYYTAASYRANTYYKGINGGFASYPNRTGCYEFGHAWNYYYVAAIHQNSWQDYLNKRWVNGDGSQTLATNDTCKNVLDGYSYCMSVDHCRLFAVAAPGNTRDDVCFSSNYVVDPSLQPGLKDWYLGAWRSDAVKPQTSLTSPTAGVLYSRVSNISVSGYAVDNISISSLLLQLDGSTLTPTITTDPNNGSRISYTIPANTLTSGSHALTLTAKDPSGNLSVSTDTFSAQ